MADLARDIPGIDLMFIKNTPAQGRKYHDKLFRGDSKRVLLPWNRQMVAAFPASIGTYGGLSINGAHP
ncbi:hypothetical protein [Mesorhizobium sp.]|uniref:hypothetical protein n=2 Tax=Mesorhizobium sp. TaxID=1871066 RepID=UPI000FE7B81A|nr:hypothetical protein [Mesorhizobium sp.]RWM25811.1 MAG: hypothetical protein EOR74_17390 [Mesorhizobium sp.]